MVPNNPELRRRVIAEFVVIVTSIMLALAGDSWLQARSDRRSEQAELKGLRSELAATRRGLGSVIRGDSLIFIATQRILTALDSARNTVQVPDTLTRQQGNTAIFQPPLGRFESLLASGRLHLIQDYDPVLVNLLHQRSFFDRVVMGTHRRILQQLDSLSAEIDRNIVSK